MLTSQVLETSIGIVFLLLILATAASAVLDLIRRLLNSRSKDLEKALKCLFDDHSHAHTSNIFQATLTALSGLFVTVKAPKLQVDAQTAWTTFTNTSLYRGASAARGQVRPAYLSAKSFAEAVEENLRDGHLPTGALGQRVEALYKSIDQDALAFRSGIERWFDETMAGLSSRYRKRSTVWLFVIGLILVGVLNVSVPHAAQELWRDSATRATVVAAAEGYTPPAADDAPSAADTVRGVADAADQLGQLGIPIGWGMPLPKTLGSWVLLVLGWILTAALISLGGPFWFDFLNRLTAIRSPKPATAADDETSATNAKSTDQVQDKISALPALATLQPEGATMVARAGQPGTVSRLGTVPTDLAQLVNPRVVAIPATTWPAGQYIVLRDGTRARWNGNAWE